MQLDDLFDYDTTTITPYEAEAWADLCEAVLANSAADTDTVACIYPELGPSLVIALTAGLDTLEKLERIKS